MLAEFLESHRLVESAQGKVRTAQVTTGASLISRATSAVFLEVAHVDHAVDAVTETIRSPADKLNGIETILVFCPRNNFA